MRRSTTQCLAALVAVALAAAAGSTATMAATLTVGPPGSGATYTTIEAALLDAGAGDTVLVHPGAYAGDLVIDEEGITLLAQVLHQATLSDSIDIQQNGARVEGLVLQITNDAVGLYSHIDGGSLAHRVDVVDTVINVDVTTHPQIYGAYFDSVDTTSSLFSGNVTVTGSGVAVDAFGIHFHNGKSGAHSVVGDVTVSVPGEARGIEFVALDSGSLAVSGRVSVSGGADLLGVGMEVHDGDGSLTVNGEVFAHGAGSVGSAYGVSLVASHGAGTLHVAGDVTVALDVDTASQCSGCSYNPTGVRFDAAHGAVDIAGDVTVTGGNASTGI